MCSTKLHVFLLLALSVSLVLSSNFPTVTQSPRTILVPEDTINGTILGNVTAEDDDGPQLLHFYIPSNLIAFQYIDLQNKRGTNQGGVTVDLVLKKGLDRDTGLGNMRLILYIEDNPGGSGSNRIQQTITIYVLDVNDVQPTFTNSKYQAEIREDTPVNSPVITVHAEDPDTGTGGLLTYNMTASVATAADDYRNAFRIEHLSGKVLVNSELDFDDLYNYYEFTVTAVDGGGLEAEPANLLIKIRDVQDKPPYFTNIPYSVNVPENIATSTPVIQVSAVDGDKGVSNTVSYSLLPGGPSMFELDGHTGWIKVVSSLDRDAEDVKKTGGVYTMVVRAKEDDDSQALNMITATATVTIIVEDVNDNGPEFDKSVYEANIMENTQVGLPISFHGAETSVIVKDKDQGENSHLEILFEKDGQPYRDFYAEPNEVFSGEANILIRVNNTNALDYEQLQTLTFQLIAREKSTLERYSSVATVIVHVEDANDNNPKFQPASLPIQNVSEQAVNGTEVVVLKATDEDKGIFGTIEYVIRGTSGKFEVDKDSGRVTVSGELDREKVDLYVVSAEARDGGGSTTYTNLYINILDENDNSPVFRREDYFANVKEDSLTFLREPVAVEATDDDQPGTDNSRVRYRITQASSGLLNKFDIEPVTGVITLRDKIDYEGLDPAQNGRVVIGIEAYDLGSPSRSSSVSVTIQVEDVNDNAPYFSSPEYTATIPESALERSSVVFVSASDDDQTTQNNNFVYRIDSGAGDKFRINFQTGEITVETGAKLDREEKDSYILNVSATDRGAISLEGYCKVNITISDVNDELPVFNPASKSATVAERDISLNNGENVVVMTATDRDSKHLLEYQLLTDSVRAYDEDGDRVNVTKYGIQDYFGVHRIDGVVYVKNQLDRETAETVILHIFVRDLLGVDFTRQTATGTVTVTIEDVNDNYPMFKQGSSYQDTYNISVFEGIEDDSEVLRLETEDRDEDKGVTYEMGSDPSRNFSVTPNTGILHLTHKLDREDKDFLVVTVIAKDQGVPPLSSTATIFVTVQDINDNNPVFDPYELTYHAAEDAGVDTSICRITATDEDANNYGRIIYSFDVQNDDNTLKINRSSGVISVARSLDRERQSSYTLFVTAMDNPGDLDNQRTNQTKAITIYVDDVNDEDPVFRNLDPNVKHTVLENAEQGHLVLTVTAEDDDVGDNAKLSYTISGDDPLVLNLFVIKTVQSFIGGVPKYFGDIEVNSNLLGKVGEYEVRVTATDHGSPARSVEASLTISVEDVNLHQPVFVQPTGPRNTIQTNEEQDPGALIMDIVASDEDHGRNADITYTILEENDWEQFEIDAKSGQLTFKNKLDRETKSSYEIKIQAEDDGVPNKLASTLTLIIVLLDINDKLPEFPRDDAHTPYIISVEEERVADQTTTDLNIAVDEDKDVNSVICYYIIAGDSAVKTHFQLNQNGILTLTQAFDRENLTNPVINMLVQATPECHKTVEIDTNARVPPVNYLIDRTVLWVLVEIKDINDNPPEFKQPVLTLGVTRGTGYGTAILNLRTLVTDKDATMKVKFTAYRTEAHLQNEKQVTDPFIVFPNGTVKTNTYFPADMYGYFLIQVRAEENVTRGLPFVANATLRISLINDDQRVKVIFRKPLDEVNGFQVQFTGTLQSVIGYRIVLDKIQTHENAAGLPEVNKTDMFIHAEDFKTNETLAAAELLRLIDTYADALYNLRREYDVTEIVPTVEAVDEEDLANVFRMALILVTILLCLLCVAICIVFYLTRQKYIRKLKAATALAYEASRYTPPPNGLQNPYHAPISLSSDYESPPTLTAVEGKVWRQTFDCELAGYSDLQKIDTPGTNQHAYENTNPIYLEKIKLEETTDDPDDDSLDDNAVDHPKPGQYSEQQMNMNFYHEDYSQQTQSKLGSGDAILSEAIQQHEAEKAKNGSVQNGGFDFKTKTFEGLPTTEI